MEPDLTTEHQRLITLLLETVTQLCKTGLTYRSLRLQGLIRITVNEEAKIFVPFNEFYQEESCEGQGSTSSKLSQQPPAAQDRDCKVGLHTTQALSKKTTCTYNKQETAETGTSTDAKEVITVDSDSCDEQGTSQLPMDTSLNNVLRRPGIAQTDNAAIPSTVLANGHVTKLESSYWSENNPEVWTQENCTQKKKKRKKSASATEGPSAKKNANKNGVSNKSAVSGKKGGACGKKGGACSKKGGTCGKKGGACGKKGGACGKKGGACGKKGGACGKKGASANLGINASFRAKVSELYGPLLATGTVCPYDYSSPSSCTPQNKYLTQCLVERLSSLPDGENLSHKKAKRACQAYFKFNKARWGKTEEEYKNLVLMNRESRKKMLQEKAAEDSNNKDVEVQQKIKRKHSNKLPRKAKAEKTNCLIVKNLSQNTDTECLLAAFEGCKLARLGTFLKTGNSTGVGFVEFDDEVLAQKAYSAMNGRQLDGRPIAVEYPRPYRHGDEPLHGGDSNPL